MGVKNSSFCRKVTYPLRASFPHVVDGTMSHLLNEYLLNTDHVLDTAGNETEKISALMKYSRWGNRQ